MRKGRAVPGKKLSLNHGGLRPTWSASADTARKVSTPRSGGFPRRLATVKVTFVWCHFSGEDSPEKSDVTGSQKDEKWKNEDSVHMSPSRDLMGARLYMAMGVS